MDPVIGRLRDTTEDVLIVAFVATAGGVEAVYIEDRGNIGHVNVRDIFVFRPNGQFPVGYGFSVMTGGLASRA